MQNRSVASRFENVFTPNSLIDVGFRCLLESPCDRTNCNLFKTARGMPHLNVAHMLVEMCSVIYVLTLSNGTDNC